VILFNEVQLQSELFINGICHTAVFSVIPLVYQKQLLSVNSSAGLYLHFACGASYIWMRRISVELIRRFVTVV